MELTSWWVVPAAAAVVVVVWFLYRRHRQEVSRLVAHGDRLTALPEYQRALGRHRTSLIVALVLASVFLGATVTAAARPAQRSTEQPEARNRDIVLCLDVSGSMTSTDAALAAVFEQLAREFDGERIGMVIFDSSSVHLFPLTDDYDYVAGQLAEARKALDSGAGSFFDGTWSRGGSSLIGDGLASCVQAFPDTSPGTGDARRSRSVIFATDNFLSGDPIFTLEQASELAKGKDVKVYALNPGDLDYGGAEDQPGAQLRAAAEATGGSYYTLDSPDAVPGIVATVEETEAAGYLKAPQAVIADSPAWPLGLALVSGAGLLLLGWRSRL
ncbi:VWA domain-containing protein [Paenarthrobacter sp. NPDC089714]|uniref:vWA domain-containing protein n=1 Tax=Paenarthrobacter sp. NPDC089714 TaxID=3364377 RepID=UPI003807DC76